MNCYVCTQHGQPEPAVALCRHCQVGLCSPHLAESRKHSQGGMHWTCNHDLRSEPTPHALARR